MWLARLGLRPRLALPAGVVQPGQARHLHPLGAVLHPGAQQRVVHQAHVHVRRRLAHRAYGPSDKFGYKDFRDQYHRLWTMGQ